MTIEEIKKAVEEGKAVFGIKKIKKLAKKKSIGKVFLSSNADMISEDEEMDIERIDNNSSEIGVICKKPFCISAVGILKNAKNKKV